MPFRLKLLAAMMLVVAAITVGALFVTNKNVTASFYEQFEQLSEAESKHFQELQRVRSEPLQHLGSSLAGRRRTISLLRAVNAAKEEPEEHKGQISNAYSTLEDEMALLKPKAEEANELFFRLLDEQGIPIRPPAGVGAGFGRTLPNTELTGALNGFTPLVGNSIEQATGFIIAPQEHKHVLVQSIFTLIWDQNTEETLGALVMGFPVEFGISKDRQVQTAVLFNGQIFSEGLAASLEQAIGTNLVGGKLPSAQGHQIVDTGNGRYYVNYRMLPQADKFSPAWQVTIHAMAHAEAQISRLTQTIIALGAVGIIAALVLSLLLAGGLTKPIGRLVAGTQEIQKGNFAVEIPVTTKDELGHLTRSFNSMAEGLQQREKLRNVLNMVADKAVAEELVAGKVALGGETRKISVLFCDIRGFTALTENMKPAEVIEMLNEHMTALTKVVYQHNGVVDKFVGDLIMAIFGAPKTYGNDALNASKCAWEMVQVRAKLNESSRYKIRMGIGIATGEAVAGCMGSEDRLNYTVLGERVNLAARLCSKAGPMQVIVDEATKNDLAKSFETEMLEPMQLKGFSESVNAYGLVNQKMS